MSREQPARSLQAPEATAFEEVHPVEPVSTEGAAAPLEARISALAQEARQELGTRREEVVGALNALLERLPRESSPDEASAVLHRLLDGGLLDGLEDAEGLPASVAATRAMTALGFPHALEVPPERLEALNRWRTPALEVPRGPLAFVLGISTVVQMGFVTMVDMGMRRMGHLMSMNALAGIPEEPTLTSQLRYLVGDAAGPIFLAQLAATVVAGGLAMAVAGRREWRAPARRGLLGLAALGLAVGGFQLALGLDEGWGTLASAGGSLVAGWLLREP